MSGIKSECNHNFVMFATRMVPDGSGTNYVEEVTSVCSKCGTAVKSNARFTQVNEESNSKKFLFG